MPNVPEPTKTSLTQSLQAHAREHWPQLADLQVRFRGQFAYLDAEVADGDVLPLCRLRYLGSTDVWGFGLYLASSDKYEDQILPTGSFTGTATDALDCACSLYLAGPTF
jgi:hypothetical protein